MIFHKPNESRQHAAAVYLVDMVRLEDGPPKAGDPFYQPSLDYQHEYNVSAFRQRVLEFLNKNKQHNSQLDDEKSCYYCTPGGGCNDDDVIRPGLCTCWCHEQVKLYVLQDRLEALL
jgi:hypothetical protein